MYLSLNWIKNWVKLPKDIKPEKLALDLTMSTVEVEEVIDQAKRLDKVVVGRIAEITKHPDADKLQVCQVRIGDSHEQIVCGGDNLVKGMTVVVALPGAKVKWHGQGDLVTLEKTKIRGIESNGMIAASEELGLENLFPQKSDKEIIDLSSYGLKSGQPLAEALGLNDIVLDIDNKSINHRPDLWSQYGLARELSAIYKAKLKDYPIAEFKTKKQTKLKVTVEDKENCFRYLALAIKNIKVEDSPWWLKTKLESVGIRPVNNIVDLTNYVMYELGQPLHAFDANMVSSHHIIVKSAIKGEKFVTLDGQSRKLPKDALMICDQQKNIALAGIMGGQNSEINPDTTEIILESANFRAANIRRTSIALGLRTESSSRFEKSLDPKLAELAIKRVANLILELSKEAYISSALVDVDHNPFKPVVLKVSEELINRRFGVAIPTQEIKDILERLDFGVTYKAKTFTIQVPSFRATKDISIPEDIVEEVARIYGYDNIEAKLPTVALAEPYLDPGYQAEKKVKRWLSLSEKYFEVHTYPFTDEHWTKQLSLDFHKHLKVKGPLSPEQSYLNLSLLPNLLKKAEENTRWLDSFKIYELERVFHKKIKGTYAVDDQKKKFLPRQNKELAGIEISLNKEEQAFLRVKGLIEAMMAYLNVEVSFERIDLPYSGLTYQIKHQDIVLGNFGLLFAFLFDSRQTDINIAFWQLDFSLLIKYIKKSRKYQPLAKFPSVLRDMSIIVSKKVSWQDLAAEISKISPLIRRIEPFDVFAGRGIDPDKKSLAFHLEFRSDDRTLLSEDIDQLMEKVLSILEKKFKASLR